MTIWRGAGLRVIIFLDDHEPAHVHVFGDGHAKINLSSPVELIWADGMNFAEVRRAVRLVGENRVAFLARWRTIHG